MAPAALSFMIVVVHSTAAIAQVAAGGSEGRDALAALLATAEHILIDADSLPSVQQPSPRALRQRRSGVIAIVVLTTTREGRDIHPQVARGFAETVAQNLTDRGITARAAQPELVDQRCPQVTGRTGGAYRQCSFDGDLGMIVAFGYPRLVRGHLEVTVNAFTDLQAAEGSLVVTAEAIIERRGDEWHFASVRAAGGR
jgi:hypothetical protein